MAREGYALITARLASPLCGEAPQLDALLELAMAPFHESGRPQHQIDRNQPAPPAGVIPIPIPRRSVAGWPVARCSGPIEAEPDATWVDHVAKRIGTEYAPILKPEARRKIVISNTWTKSYRLPMRIRQVSAVCWFAVGRAGVLRTFLARHITAIGKKRSVGYGRIAAWEAQPWPEDWTWFAPDPDSGKPILMRPLPVGDGSHLPGDLIGARRDFGACVSPYWHPERYTEIVVPC